MSRIVGTVSRSVPLDGLVGRSLTLTGTFDLFVSSTELAKIRSILDILVASGILTNHNAYQESDSLLQGTVGNAADSPISTSGSASIGVLDVIPIAIPDAGDTTYTFKTDSKIEIVDVVVRKSGAGAGNTIAVQDSSAAAISDSIAAAVDKTVTRAGTIDPAKNVIAAGGTFKVFAHRAAGTMLAEVFIYVLRRP